VTAAAILWRPDQASITQATLLADAADLQLGLLDGRFTACSAELPNWPSEPHPRVRC
jgi:hypothetical protein